MPALVVCGKHWLVASDDFVLPALIAILVRLPCIGLTIGVIIYLFFGPAECLDENSRPERVPPFVYGSLFGFAVVLVMSVFNEAIIFSVSFKGTIMDPERKRRRLLLWLFIRSILMAVEVLTSLTCMVAVYGPAPFAADALQCREYHDGPLVFARAVVVVMVVVELFYIFGFLVFIDPLGICCSPSIIPSIHEEVDSLLYKSHVEQKDHEYVSRSRLGRLHTNHVGYGKVVRKLRGALCCWSANGNRSRQTALREMALAVYTLFKKTNENHVMVTSDIIAGLTLVSRRQKKTKQRCEDHKGAEAFKCPCLIVGLRTLTFNHMPKSHLPDNFTIHELPPPVPFDPSSVREQLLLDDLIHYMRYSMGMYGWPLHVYDNLTCGICQLMCATCCRCKYRRWHRLAQEEEGVGVRVVQDDCCMSGLATLSMRTKLQEQHIVYMNYENEVFQAPYSVCIDHSRKAVVLTVRGTLSIKDAMTDLSVSMEEIEPQLRNPHVEGKQYVHKGMYITAKHIFKYIVTEGVLERAFKEAHEQYHEHCGLEDKKYRLIITGHSLGGGVASVLSILLKPFYPDLFCYAFSPPGCIFSFPLAHYSQSFIKAVVLGNDMIPRITFRSLFYLKRQVDFMMRVCSYSKFQVIFRPRVFDDLPLCARKCLFGDKEDPDLDISPTEKELEERLRNSEGARKVSFGGVASNLVRAKRAANRWNRLSKNLEGTLHGFVVEVEQGKLVASFPPRSVVHIPVKHSKKPWLLRYCYPDKIGLNHVNSEDICVIIIDRGMIDDHLPNNVLKALLRCKKELVGTQYNSHQVEALREQENLTIQEAIEHRIPVVVPKDEVLSDDSLALHEKGQNGVSSTSNGSEAIYVPENGAAKPKNIVWGKVPLKYVLESDESPL